MKNKSELYKILPKIRYWLRIERDHPDRSIRDMASQEIYYLRDQIDQLLERIDLDD
jgi:hypothetical protein